MGFFDKVADFGKQAAQKTGDAVESGKLTLKIKEKQKDILKVNTEIGKYVYETSKSGAVYDTEITALIEKIRGIEAEISALNDAKEDLSDDDNDNDNDQPPIVEEAVRESEDE